MNLRITKKSFLISFLIFTQYLAPVRSSLLDKSQFNKVSDKLLITGWKPSSGKNIYNTQASVKTIKALNKFKNISSLKPYFKKARGYAIYPNIGKGGIGIGAARGSGEVFERGNIIGSTTLFTLALKLYSL